ncbi:MAG: DUF4386 domain-containing protein [Actinobacteria bacterium]|nr:DUF4386 domain-containing protein [Actinomycetota bacterium]MCG2800327.1 DUF4386 domain-containing protein [Cellulomonas sp.]
MNTMKSTARLTGLAYLGLAISGVLGLLVVRGQLYVPGDAAATTANLVEHGALARFGVAVDLTTVLTQALAALWFFTLFRRVSSLAAGAITAFGIVNSVVILGATVFSATALGVVYADSASTGDLAATAQLLYELSGTAWDLGGLFFGLWLIPMGWLAWRSGFMPRALGWVLIGGGVGYVLSTYLVYLAPNLTGLSSALTVPASIGEFWMVGYLLWKGVGSGVVAQGDQTARGNETDSPLGAAA